MGKGGDGFPYKNWSKVKMLLTSFIAITRDLAIKPRQKGNEYKEVKKEIIKADFVVD